MAESYDLVVIGTGPGGYVCAIRAAQLGLKVAVVEKRKTHGGTCLNVGCIPSKALLHATERYAELPHLAKMGISVGRSGVDLSALMAFKDEAVAGNTAGVAYLLKKNKIAVHHGRGRIVAPGKVQVTDESGNETALQAAHIVIATGSVPATLPGIDIDETRIVTSTGALSLSKVPKHLLVVGAGVIGLELGAVWHRLGAQVTVVEFLDRILPGMDHDLAKAFQRIAKKQGFAFRLGTKVTAISRQKSGLTVSLAPAKETADGTEKTEQIKADVALIAIGRVPYTEGLGLEALGVEKDERGRIVTREGYATSVPGIYAIGDVIAGPMLAHKAEEEGIALAELLAGKAGHVNYDVIPAVVYTQPEIASVGRTEDELKADGVPYRVGKFPFTANGRAKAVQNTEGFVKVLAHAQTDRVLGVHILGAQASEMIAEAAVLMEFGGAAEDLARTCHAHPTLTEAIREAALAVDGRPIHM